MTQQLTVQDIQIVCISLDRTPERWYRFQKDAARAGIDVTRLSAVDARTFDATTHPAVSVGTANNIKSATRRSHYEIDSAGAVGCSLSHFRAWRSLLDSGAPAMVIFEDDTRVPPDFRQRLTQLLHDLPPKWDIVQFYNTRYNGGVFGCQPDPTRQPWSTCENIMGAFAYMISPSGAQKMLKDAFPIELHVDAYMAYMCRLNRVDVIWHPLMDILPTFEGSTIGHGATDILNVPTNMRRNGIVAMELTAVMGLVLVAGIVGGILGFSYRRR